MLLTGRFKMNTKLLMTSSAVFLALIGLGLSFFPTEILNEIDVGACAAAKLALQALGAAYLGFALMNWMSRGAVIGGIYYRPMVMGNLMHFMVVAITLAKYLLAITPEPGVVMWVAMALYFAFAVAFMWVAFLSPRVN